MHLLLHHMHAYLLLQHCTMHTFLPYYAFTATTHAYLLLQHYKVLTTASTEVNAASAASGGDTSEEDSLIDFNEVDEKEAARKAAEREALKRMLAENGFKYRNLLRSEKVKQHFTSPFERKYNVYRRHTFGNTER